MSILLVWFSGLVFGLLHSFTASNRCKVLFYSAGMQPHQYRLLYSVAGALTTVAWVWFVQQLTDTQLYQSSGLVWWLLLSLQLLGAAIALAALLPIDGAVFLGLRKSPSDADPFVVEGIYKFIRHPMYSGAMLILLFMPEQTMNGLNFAIMVSVYFVVGSKFEEKRMLLEHSDYESYQKTVPAFIPKLKR